MDIVAQAVNIIDEAQKNKVVLRALGGIAIGLHCPSAKHRSFVREYADIDLVGLTKQDRAIKGFFVDLGFEPNKMFNALHGKKRLQFRDAKRKVDVDIFLDIFEMCHKLNFKDRLDLEEYTVSLADLLMTKLQIVELNDKDVKDIMVIIKDHALGKEAHEKIDIDYIAKLCSEDWGLCKTLSMNADKILKLAGDYSLSDEDAKTIKSRLSTFLKRLEEEPKSLRWRMRSRVGEKVKWYETVEEVKR